MNKNLIARIAGAFVRPVYGGIGCIVCLHRIASPSQNSVFAQNRALEIGSGDLRKILQWVRDRGLQPIGMDEVAKRLQTPRAPKFVAFTFDDGYADNLTKALPVFQEFDIPFTVYIAAGLLDRTAYPWWYALEELVVGRDHIEFRWRGEDINISCRGTGARDRGIARLGDMTRGLGIGEREEFLATVFAEKTEAVEAAKSLMLTWEQARELSASPLVTIGAHTVGHYQLNRLSEIEAEQEIERSRTELERRLNRKVVHFAFPFGGRNAVGEREFAMVRNLDFHTGVTTRSANLFPAHGGALDRLPRLGVSGNYPPASRLGRLESGLLPALEHRWKRIITT